jgi:hypothetical protein
VGGRDAITQARAEPGRTPAKTAAAVTEVA